MNQISCLPALAKSVHLHSHQHGQILKGNSIEKYEPILIIQLTSHENVIGNMLVYKSRLTIRQLTTRLQSKRKTVFNQRLICKKILNMLGSYGDLGDCGKISASTVFETITDITLLKYLKSLVTCHSLFKQTSKKENPSSCFTSTR